MNFSAQKKCSSPELHFSVAWCLHSGRFLGSLLKLILEDAARADLDAVAALDALAVVDHGEEVLDLDRFRRALLLALHAADAAGVADLARDGALVRVAAALQDGLPVGDLLDELLRADVAAGEAADALVAVDLRNAVDDVHGVELAGAPKAISCCKIKD